MTNEQNRISKSQNGFYYRNEFWCSPAYQKLSCASRDLLQCLLTELKRERRKNTKRREWIITNNGEISFTVLQYKKLSGHCKQSYTNARNQLITNGIIIQTYQGGNRKGDMAQYKILCTDDIIMTQQRWRKYPGQSWENDIPKTNKQRIGSKTQWKKGECGRKSKPTLSECTLNKPNDPIVIDPKK